MRELSSTPLSTVSPQKVKQMVRDGDEIALLDVREQGVFSTGHPLLACSMPLSHLELLVEDLVPRLRTRIVLVDQGPSDMWCLAERAAGLLERLGDCNVATLAGGIDGWVASGFELFSGVNVFGKAFGEFIRATYDTPDLTVEALKGMMERGEKVVVLDARPSEEYHFMNIPGSINTPGGELVYRVHDLAPDPDTAVVINCAGRTRSIIGAQSLINAGIPNRVAALRNGTMAWHLAGFELEHGQSRFAPSPSPAGLAKAKASAARVARRFGIKKVTRRVVDQWMSETESRTLYLLDVRLPEEFVTGYVQHSRNVPGGQLVQAIDEHVVVRNARIVVIDDTEVRATMTASWLVQMGWTDVYVLAGGIGDGPLILGPRTPHIRGFTEADTVTPWELKELLDSEQHVTVLDVASSRQYRGGHIPDAYWGVRSRFRAEMFPEAPTGLLVLTSPDGVLAHLACEDAVRAWPATIIRVLQGGTDAWIKAGLPTTVGMEHVTCDVDDVWDKPYEVNEMSEEMMRHYLAWEVTLRQQIERDSDITFRSYR